MTPPQAEATAVDTGRECARCDQALRPDWNFCPTCALPVGTGAEVLSPQIRVLRTESASGDAPPATGSNPAMRVLAASATGLLLTAVAGTGLLVWHPEVLGEMFPSSAGSHGATPDLPRTEPGPATGTIAWVRVDAGDFRYGHPANDRNWTDEGEIPAFEIMMYEVSNAQWLEYLHDRRADLVSLGQWRASVPPNWIWVAGASGREEERVPRIPRDGEDLPVRGITYEQAEDFCAWLDATGRAPGARMPREDEWEKAARGTDGRTYPWNGEFLERVAVAGRVQEFPRANVGSGGVQPVNLAGGRGADISPWGAYNMGGNVSEWTDLWGRETDTDLGPAEKYRVIRGASFQETAEDGAVFARTYNDTASMQRTLGQLSVGFRVARDAPEGDAAPGGGK